MEEKKKEKVRCPYCGHPTNVMKKKDASCSGIFLKCKNRECRKEFEVKL